MKFPEFTDLLREALGAPEADRLCAILCQRAGGESIYIPARQDKPVIAPSDTPAVVARKYRVSRTTAYRWVSRWRL